MTPVEQKDDEKPEVGDDDILDEAIMSAIEHEFIDEATLIEEQDMDEITQLKRRRHRSKRKFEDI